MFLAHGGTPNLIISRTVNLTFEKMPTHELVSRSGDISLGRVLGSKYKKVNSIRNQWSTSFFFLWVDAYQPSSGFHANLSDGWLFESEGNLFQSRMKVTYSIMNVC